MAIKERDGADNIRLEDKVMVALTDAIAEFRPWFGHCAHGVLSWHLQDTGIINVEFKATLRLRRRRS